VDEAETGRAAQSVDRCLGDAVHALGRGGDGLVHRVAGVEGAGGVDAPGPWDADPCGLRAVAVLDPAAFSSEELVPGEAVRVLVGEALAVHLAGHFQPRAAVRPLRRLRLDEGGRAVE